MITDLAGLFFWAHRGVDMHLLAWPQSAAEVERIARSTNAIHVLAPTDEAFFSPVDPAAARARLGLPAEGRIVLVSGGGWGVRGPRADRRRGAGRGPGARGGCGGPQRGGSRSARATLRRGRPRAGARLHGRDERPARRGRRACPRHGRSPPASRPRCGGCPTVIHGFAVGHVQPQRGRDEQAGTGQAGTERRGPRRRSSWLRHRAAPGRRPAAAEAELPSAADVVAAARSRIRPLPRWWLAMRRISPTGAGALAAALALSTSGGYAIAAVVEDDFGPVQHVTVSQPEVALVVRPAPGEVQPLLERLTASAHLPVTVAGDLPAAAGGCDRRRPGRRRDRAGSWSGQAVRWFATSSRLGAIRRDVGESGRAPYIAPERGFTLGQYVLGRTAHGYPVRPLRRSPDSVQPGDIVQAGDWESISRISIAGSAPEGSTYNPPSAPHRCRRAPRRESPLEAREFGARLHTCSPARALATVPRSRPSRVAAEFHGSCGRARHQTASTGSRRSAATAPDGDSVARAGIAARHRGPPAA